MPESAHTASASPAARASGSSRRGEQLEHAQAARLPGLERGRTALRICVSHAGRRLRQQLGQIRAREILAQPLGRDDQRIEQPAVALVAGQLDHVHAARRAPAAPSRLWSGLGSTSTTRLPRRSAWNASSSAAIVLPDPSVPASRIDGGRPVREASVMSNFTGRSPPGHRAADVDAALATRPGGCRPASARRTARSSARRRSRAPCRRPRAADDRGTAPAAARAAGAARPCRTRWRSASTRCSSSSARRRRRPRARSRTFSSGGRSCALQVGVELARQLPVLLDRVGQRPVRGGQLLASRRCRRRRSAGAPARPRRGCRSSARAARSRPGTRPPPAARTAAPPSPGNSVSSGSAPSASIA